MSIELYRYLQNSNSSNGFFYINQEILVMDIHVRDVGKCLPTSTTKINTSNILAVWTRETGSSLVASVPGIIVTPALCINYYGLHIGRLAQQNVEKAVGLLTSCLYKCLHRWSFLFWQAVHSWGTTPTDELWCILKLSFQNMITWIALPVR